MAEHGADDGVWDHRGPVILAELGVSEGLVRRLKTWNGD
jgi:hypothetical protein